MVFVPNWQILGYNSDTWKLKLANADTILSNANFTIESISVPSFQPYHQISINIRFYRSPNIPGLVKNYFCWKSFFLCVCFSPYNWTSNVNTLKKCDFKTKFIKRAASLLLFFVETDLWTSSLNILYIIHFKSKEWLLARKFCEFEYSPKTRHFQKYASTRQTRRHSPSRVARTRRTCRHLPKAIFEKNVTRIAKFTRVIFESRKFGASSHSLIFTQLSNNLKMALYNKEDN